MTAGRLAVLAFLTTVVLVPVTLPVTVLRELVGERFAVGELATSAFMSINMVGALLAAPLIGALSDRIGRRKPLIVACLVVDGLLFAALTLPVPFAVFMGLRLLEGAAHIGALSLLLAIAAEGAAPGQRGRVMGTAGAGIMLGVALGAPLGGLLGATSILLPLQVGAGLSLAAAAVGALSLSDSRPSTSRPSLAALVRVIAAEKALLVPLTFTFIDRFTVGFYTTTFSLYLGRVHGLGPARVGFLLALFLLPFSLLCYPAGRLSERGSRALLLCAGSLVYGLATASLTWWPVVALPYLMFGLGLASAVMFAPSLVLTTDLADDRAKATAMGGFNAAGSLGFLVGPLVGGAITQSMAAGGDWSGGYRLAFLTAGLAEVLCVLVALPFLRRLVRSGRTT